MVEISGIASKGSSIHQRDVRIFVFWGKADKKLSAFRGFFQKRTMQHDEKDGCNGWDERDGCYESTTECRRENPDSAFQHVQCGMCVKPVQYVATPHDVGSFFRRRPCPEEGASRADSAWCTAACEATHLWARDPRRAKKKGLAATYSPASLQYHRRESA